MRGILLLLLVLGCGSVPVFAEAKPNFIIINVADLGYADISPFGAKNRTPNLDRMAAEGRKLTSHYAAPRSSLSRAALMTGCYPKRVLPIRGDLMPAAAVGLHPEERTIAEVLKDAGYRAFCVGKWHLGDQLEFLPTRQGFDAYFGIPYSNDMGPAADGCRSNLGKPIPPPPVNDPAKHSSETGLQGTAQPPLPLLEDEKVVRRVRAEDQATITREYTERAVRFIREAGERPFFLYLAHTAVHLPHYPSEEFRDKARHRGRGLFADCVLEVDWSTGEILQALRETGLAERTLVLFTSDNGGLVPQAPFLRAGDTSEGRVRVCTIAWWPGRIPAGTSTDAITTAMDILPTFAALADARLPERKIDGVDIWPLLAGTPGTKPPREDFFYFNGPTLEAVRSGPWKLRLARMLYLRVLPAELYNLVDDPGETRDVASAHRGVVKSLQGLADTMNRDLGARGDGPGCRLIGRLENPEPLISADGTVRANAVGEHSQFP